MLAIGSDLDQSDTFRRAARDELGAVRVATVSARAVSRLSALSDALQAHCPFVVALTGCQGLQLEATPGRLFLLERPGILVHAVVILDPEQITDPSGMQEIREHLRIVADSVDYLRSILF